MALLAEEDASTLAKPSLEGVFWTEPLSARTHCGNAVPWQSSSPQYKHLVGPWKRLLAMASNLLAMASNLSVIDRLQPDSNGLQPTSNVTASSNDRHLLASAAGSQIHSVVIKTPTRLLEMLSENKGSGKLFLKSSNNCPKNCHIRASEEHRAGDSVKSTR